MTERQRDTKERNAKTGKYAHQKSFYGNGKGKNAGKTYIMCDHCDKKWISDGSGKYKLLSKKHFEEDVTNGLVVWGE